MVSTRRRARDRVWTGLGGVPGWFRISPGRRGRLPRETNQRGAGGHVGDRIIRETFPSDESCRRTNRFFLFYS